MSWWARPTYCKLSQVTYLVGEPSQWPSAQNKLVKSGYSFDLVALSRWESWFRNAENWSVFIPTLISCKASWCPFSLNTSCLEKMVINLGISSFSFPWEVELKETIRVQKYLSWDLGWGTGSFLDLKEWGSICMCIAVIENRCLGRSEEDFIQFMRQKIVWAHHSCMQPLKTRNPKRPSLEATGHYLIPKLLIKPGIFKVFLEISESP